MNSALRDDDKAILAAQKDVVALAKDIEEGKDAKEIAKKAAAIKKKYEELNHVMQIYSLFMFLGIFTTLCIPETKRKTLEELSGETEQNPAYELTFFSGFFRPRTPDRRRRAQREED